MTLFSQYRGKHFIATTFMPYDTAKMLYDEGNARRMYGAADNIIEFAERGEE